MPVAQPASAAGITGGKDAARTFTNTLIQEINMEKFKPKDKAELVELLKKSTPLESIDVSMVTDFSDLGGVFSRHYLTGIDMQGIDTWDVSGAVTLARMFEGCYNFNEDISGWTVDNVTDTAGMLDGCDSFTHDLSGWAFRLRAPLASLERVPQRHVAMACAAAVLRGDISFGEMKDLMAWWGYADVHAFFLDGGEAMLQRLSGELPVRKLVEADEGTFALQVNTLMPAAWILVREGRAADEMSVFRAAVRHLPDRRLTQPRD